MNWLSIVLSVMGTLGVGSIISAIVVKRINKMDKAMAERTAERIKENTLIMRGILCTGELCMATAEAVKTGHANGEVSEAEREYKNYRKDLQGYLLEQNAKRNN